MFTVYCLQSLKDNRTYIGQTNDFKKRFSEHENGKVKSTKYRRPLVVLFTEEFESSSEAKDREIWWKSGAGRRKLKVFFK